MGPQIDRMLLTLRSDSLDHDGGIDWEKDQKYEGFLVSQTYNSWHSRQTRVR